MSDAKLLLVDDREENLLALEAILEPLGHRCVSVTSGSAALKELLLDDFACILLDVQMPELDGFELAELIKRRERSQHIPIIFVTALSKDERHVFRGYSSGAVDYIFKPIEPEILRSKVGVFVELWEKGRQLQEQAEQLHEQELAALEQASEERYRQLADAMPQIVWTADAEGAATYFNRRWFDYTGMADEHAGPNAWHLVVHPDDLPLAVSRREQTLCSGETFEVEYRFRDAGGSYRWHLGRAVPMRAADGSIEFWIGTATDIHDRKRIEEQQRFIVSAGDELTRSLDYRETLRRVAELAAGEIADWCVVHIVESDGAVVQIAIAHRDRSKVTFARELQDRYPPENEATGPAAVIRTGEPELVPEITPELVRAAARDDLHFELLQELGLESYVCVPLKGLDGVPLGAITLVSSDAGLRFGAEDLVLAEELARRAASAIENARLYHEAEARAQAAQVLATIGDGVALVDRSGRIRLWNAAAAVITGLQASDVMGKQAPLAIPGWSAVAELIPVASGGESARAENIPLQIGERELWLSISAVGYEEGTVYAFRDLTDERALETMRQDLVATVSHELRTPLAAIYGAALTLRRDDVELEGPLHDKLLEVIAEESNRLSNIVNDLLLASQLDTGTLRATIERCDPREIAGLEMDAARMHLPETITLVLSAPDDLPAVAADPGQLRQVLGNLIENAIKYSPGGGTIDVTLEPVERHVRFAIRDSGLGIPKAEQRRIFEKFYRLDPDMARGIGGTGLGLYICRELVRRVDGRIWVESDGRSGSTFIVEIPQAAAVPAVVAHRRITTPV
ncbi:MAG TPA: ATP-binding protein [Gaiellaceae bacterium]|nr:ATP-binding protein [Gaiellaceae bacterium]